MPVLGSGDGALSEESAEDRTTKMKKLLGSYSAQSIKSKKLETKMQKDFRGARCDFEAQMSCEEWKFRKNIQALDLEYQKKLLNLVESHSCMQKKLNEKFQRQIHKTEKKLKKQALHGRLNEGNCFNVSHDLSTFNNQ